MPFLVGNCEHTVGDRRCMECWSGHPRVCQCKGLIHANFIKESWNKELFLEFLCDNCGVDYKPLVIKKPRVKKPYDKRRRNAR